MRIAMPEAARRITISDPEQAIREYAEIVRELRHGGTDAELEAVATDAVETALAEHAVLMAVVLPADAAPALLTGVDMEGPASFDDSTTDTVTVLRESVENLAGPTVRETVVLHTGLGPAVLAQRVPGVEQVRAREPLSLQLQAFLPEPGTGRMLLLTLACPSAHGWSTHQRLFAEMVASAHVPGTDPELPHRPVPPDDESFETHTYAL
ncbi:hypothetical protein EV193_104229 [Herbihabitans rhizosphaerae]|uniref:Uncharacterized protein n=1 Tax=Herbihabitans rhizosphaerae TaxID=1872711 RepID=A0A4Q7KQB2_9PSEU|nr:hypothetical protein [Herbihabitans rhizosphaerae]RZS39018.1 hypothetical protein EV193_104229 [Herbihabitans rhizosphaerae]